MNSKDKRKKYAAILGIDSGRVSGSALSDHFSWWLDSNSTASERRMTVHEAFDEIGDGKLLIVMEDWASLYLPSGKRMGTKSILTMGENRGKWLQEIERFEPKRYDLVKVPVRTWRKPFGLNGMPKDQAKKMALAIASKETGQIITDHNVAEAVLLAKYGYNTYAIGVIS
jgi:hypothetical protein